jgi:hypothetical protein
MTKVYPTQMAINRGEQMDFKPIQAPLDQLETPRSWLGENTKF